jgi:hypothetical protein
MKGEFINRGIDVQAAHTERRLGRERRTRSLIAYWRGALTPRRRSGRRTVDHIYPTIDWHPARVFALVMLILVLCVADGVLTVVLIANGAVEANPVMAIFVPHALGWFAAVKLTLTTLGIMVLVACSRMRLFRVFSGEILLYAILACYVALVIYEVRMLDTITRV